MIWYTFFNTLCNCTTIDRKEMFKSSVSLYVRYGRTWFKCVSWNNAPYTSTERKFKHSKAIDDASMNACNMMKCDPCYQFPIQPPSDVIIHVIVPPSHLITFIEWSDKVKPREAHCDVLRVSAGKLSEAANAEHQVLETVSRMLLRQSSTFYLRCFWTPTPPGMEFFRPFITGPGWTENWKPALGLLDNKKRSQESE